jgi:hypothetical protein
MGGSLSSRCTENRRFRESFFLEIRLPPCTLMFGREKSKTKAKGGLDMQVLFV